MADGRRRFTAVVCHKNRPNILGENLARLHETWGAWIDEILVVDDGSDAGQVPRTEDLPPKAKLIRHEKSQGPAVRRNQAVAAATSPLILFLDDDSQPASGNLDAVAAAFDDPRLGAIGFRVMLGDQCESGGAFNAFVACGACVRKKAFLDVGGFPADFGFYVEEYSLCYRLIEKGWAVRMVDEPSILHQKAGAQRSQAAILSKLVVNNRRCFEPHADRLMDVRRRLDEILDWYELLGARLGVSNEVQAARREQLPPPTVVLEPWTKSLWNSLSGRERLDRFVSSLRQLGVEQLSLWPIGKDCRTFVETLEREGIQVLEILDPTDRFSVSSFVDRPVQKIKCKDSQGVVVASFSPGLCWNGLFGPSQQQLTPLFAAFPFESLTGNDGEEFQQRVEKRVIFFGSKGARNDQGPATCRP